MVAENYFGNCSKYARQTFMRNFFLSDTLGFGECSKSKIFDGDEHGKQFGEHPLQFLNNGFNYDMRIFQAFSESN